MRLHAAIRLLALAFVLAALGASPAQADFDYSSPQGVGTFLNLEQGSCPTTTFCAVGNSGGDVFTTANPTGGSAAWTGKNVGIASAISGISCPDTTLCVGVDTAGDVITSTNPTAGSSATWTVTAVDAGFQVRGVSCPTTTLCVAVDESGRVITSTNPTGGAAAWTKFSVGASGGFYQVDCPTTTLCVAVDSFGEVATSTNPTGGFGFWAVATIDGTNPLFSVDCNASLCLAGDQHGNVVASNNPAGGSPAWHLTDLDTSTTTNSLFGVSCPSSTLCVAADNDGKIWTSTAPLANPAVWTGTQTGASRFTGLMCPSTALCVAPTNDGSVVVATPAKPAVLTLAADDVTASSATVHGSVNPKGFNVTACKFDIGNAAGSYQSSVDCAQTVGGGSGAVPVSANLGALAPSTTVHFRARATTASGTSVGIDQSFTTPAFVAEPGNVATWHLDSQSAGTTPDSSGHGHDGQQVSATPAAGRFNNAFQLSNTGDGFVVPNSFSLEGRIGLTTMAWVKRSGTPGNFRTILGKGALSCSSSAYALDTASNGGLRFYVAFNSGIAQTPAVAPSAVWDGQWHAIGGTWDATTGSVSLWLDGRKVSTTQSPGGDPAYDSYPEKQLGVGRFPDSSCSLGGFQYTGQLDEVRVYGRSLQPYEIAYLQRQEPTTPRTLPAPIPPVFTDFTSLVGGVAHGTLAGRSVTVSGSTIQGTGAGSTMDGSSTQFAGKAWDPSLSHSDALDLVSPSGGATYTLHFGEPVTDPVFHLGAVNAQISFPAGTQVTRVSGGPTFTVSGASVNGSGGANGTVRVTGTFTTLTLSTAVSTGFFLEVGTAVGAHDTPLLVRWPLDIIDDGRSPDFSGHELDGTAASAAIVSGRFGGAYDLNGTSQGFDFTDPTSTGLLEPPGSFTVAGWVRGGPAPGAPGANTFILAKGGGCRDPSYSLGTGDNGGLEFGVQFDSGPPGAFDVVRSTPITPESVWDGTWHSVVGVYDQSTGGGARTVSLWLDGVHVGGATVPAGYGNVDFASDHVADRQLTVGYTPMSGTFGSGCTERRFHGAIDELRMYEIALTRRQVQYVGRGDLVDPPNLADNTAPRNTTRPAMSGTPKPGSALTCTQGQWTGDPGSVTYTTVWERAPRATTIDDDSSWQAINGAVGSQYTVQEEDVPSRVRCRVTRTDNGGTGEAFSNSLRVDDAAPVSVGAPFITGVPATDASSANPLGITCHPGNWQNNPDFAYQWVRDGGDIAGATSSTYHPRHTRIPGSGVSDPSGDGQQNISCRVTATNDVGSSAADSAPVLAVDGVPLNVRPPAVTFVRRPAGVSDTGAVATCDEGQWVDGYGIFQTSTYPYHYQWLRNGAAISGATEHHYVFTDADLGRGISCRVTDSNPIGESDPATSPEELLRLPVGPSTATIYRAGGNNSADPTNLMALSDRYVASIRSVVADRLQAAVDKYRERCKTTYHGPASPPAHPEAIKAFLNGIGKCQVMLYDYDHVSVNYQGVSYLAGKCTPLNQQVTADRPACVGMRFKIPAIDPLRPPAADADVLARVRDATPETVLWDLDGNGTTDAACPGSAPVLRTIFNDGNWNPRAVIVDGISKTDLVYPNATKSFHAGPAGGRAGLRPTQVKVCATSFDPPPNPQKTPCVTSASAGRVQVTGDLCPIDARDIKADDFAALDGDVKDLLKAASEHRLFSEGTATGKRVAVEPPTWVPLTPVPTGAHARRVAPADVGTTATLDNVAASLSSLAPNNLAPKPIQDRLSDTVKNIGSLQAKDAEYAVGQIYVASGAGMVVNGVRVEPQGNSLALLVPSDVNNGLSSVKAMTINARSAKTFLGPVGDAHAIPLDDPAAGPSAAFKKTLSDAKAGAADELKNINLDSLKHAAAALNLGPFKLGGDAHVTLNDDGTATLKAFAELPGLKVGPAQTDIRTDVTLTGDLQGRLHLQGIHFKAGLAYLGAAELRKLDFTYDKGTLDIKGEIDIPPPASAGIEIKEFRLAADGPHALSVDYVAGPGGGIPVGPGVYITRIGGGFDRDSSILNGDTTVSVGPSPSGGCPTAGIKAGFNTHLAEQFYLDVTGDVELICIPIVTVKFHADQTGLVTLDGGIDWSAGPIFINGSIGGAIRLPNWQFTFDASGGIRHIPIIGTVEVGLQAVLSNRGLAACASVEFLGVTLAGGAAEPFHNGRPPFTPTELIANLELFRGCGIGKYNSVVARKVVRSARAGSSAFTLPAGSKPVLLSIEGAGGAPRVILHGPGGQTFDYTDATGEHGKRVGESAGSVIEEEDRTVIILAKPSAGAWTAEVAAGSPAILRIKKAGFLPKPKVRAKVLGHGSSRVLKYNVAAIAGQSVRFVEQAKGGQTAIKTVKAGGKGKARFTVSEATSPKRTIEAQVVQDDIPRATLVVAHFTAASPHVVAPRHLRVRRSGRKAIVTWRKQPLARAYEVTVTYGVGRVAVLKPKGRATRVVVPRVRKGEGLRVGVVAFSPAGHRSRAAKAKLSGNMHVGAKHKKKKRAHRRRVAA